MTRIKGYGFTRKDKVFAEFETDHGKYLFKESHSSHKGVYDIGIYNPSGEKVFKIKMNREQMNKIKMGTGIANIDFFSEEGFNNYIQATYIDKDFDEERFRDFFKKHFIREYKELNSEDYYYYDENKSLITGTFDEYYIEYMAYLVDKAPDFILENIYNEKPDAFTKIFHYTDKTITSLYVTNGPARSYGERYRFLDSAKAQILQSLNARNINYMSYEEFVKSGEYSNYKATNRDVVSR